MADKTGIEWTDATWNPIRGCTRVSPGCGGPGPHGGCYAESVAARFSGPGQPYEGLAERTSKGPRWTGKVAFIEHALMMPLRWTKPRRIFVNSMSDLFHEDVPDEWIDRIFAVMALAPQHTFQILTKRSARMRAYIGEACWPHAKIVELHQEWDCEDSTFGQQVRKVLRPYRANGTEDSLVRWPLRNVWLGVSAEDQQRADERVPDLLKTPAAVRFVSAEPLLGPINFGRLRRYDGATFNVLDALTGVERPELTGVAYNKRLASLAWIIAGGESGPKARPMHPDWARAIRDQCAAADVAFFFKQWGEWQNPGCVREPGDILQDGLIMRRVGKKLAGRWLNGREHSDFPAGVP